MKRLSVGILSGIITDAGTYYSVNTAKDIAHVTKRVASEGTRFLEVTLKELDSILLDGLEHGSLPPFSGWKSSGKIPLFLSFLWNRIFDPSSGDLLTDPDAQAVSFIRQISRTFTKVFEVCSDDRVADEIERFIKVDRELFSELPERTYELQRVFQAQFWSLISDSLSEAVDNAKHGPGAVSERLDSVEKFEFRNVDRRLLETFGPEPFRCTWHDLLNIPIGEVEGEARLVAVPKTADKPRLICIEPVATQYLQQGVQFGLRARLQRFRPLDYTDQNRNRRMAQLGSIDGSYATIDLSEASDRVHNRLVMKLLEGSWMDNPIQALRTRLINTPDGRHIPLKKFAAMGSALTFPFEVMVFFSIVTLAILGKDTTKRDYRNFMKRGDVSVYGDDIIIPVEHADRVTALLVHFGFKVNTSKSFMNPNSRFRESCGMDAYKGYDVTPAYSRQLTDADTLSGKQVISLISLRNQLWHRGYYTPCRVIDDHLRRYRVAQRPCLGECLDGTLCSVDTDDSVWDKRLQTRKIRVLALKAKRTRTRASDDAKLFAALKWADGGIGTPDEKRLTHSSRPSRTYLTRGWVVGF